MAGRPDPALLYNSANTPGAWIDVTAASARKAWAVGSITNPLDYNLHAPEIIRWNGRS